MQGEKKERRGARRERGGQEWRGEQTSGKPAKGSRGGGDPGWRGSLHRVTWRHALPRCAHLINGPGPAAGSHPQNLAAS